MGGRPAGSDTGDIPRGTPENPVIRPYAVFTEHLVRASSYQMLEICAGSAGLFQPAAPNRRFRGVYTGFGSQGMGAAGFEGETDIRTHNGQQTNSPKMPRPRHRRSVPGDHNVQPTRAEHHSNPPPVPFLRFLRCRRTELPRWRKLGLLAPQLRINPFPLFRQNGSRRYGPHKRIGEFEAAIWHVRHDFAAFPSWAITSGFIR